MAMAIGLAVRVLSPNSPGGWREGRVDVLTGRVIVDGKAVTPGRVWGICHDRQRQQAHEAPKDPVEVAYWVLIGTIFWPEKRLELEMVAGWRDPVASMAHARAARMDARAVTVTRVALTP